MIIHYKKESTLVKYVTSKEKIIIFKENTWLDTLLFKEVKYPDIYFHTGIINATTKTIIENSKLTIVHSQILKKELYNNLNIQEDKIAVVYPYVDVKKFKKKESKIAFYKKNNIESDKKIIYFTALNFKKSGFEDFCEIINTIESENFQVVISVIDEKEKQYALDIIKKHELLNDIIIEEDEVFEIADIFLLPTTHKNISINVIKAMASKCAVFVPQGNHTVEIVDVFSIMNQPNDSNTAYKIDMILRDNAELKKIQKDNYNIGKKFSKENQEIKLNKILNTFTVAK